MTRRTLLLAPFAVAGGGCFTLPDPTAGLVPPPPKPGARPPTFAVADAIDDCRPFSFFANPTGVGWVSDVYGDFHQRAADSRTWRTQFTSRLTTASDPIGRHWRLPATEYERILVPLREAVLAAVADAGGEVTEADPPTFRGDPPAGVGRGVPADPIRGQLLPVGPEGRFVVRYTLAGEARAGDVVAVVAPVGGASAYTVFRMTAHEHATAGRQGSKSAVGTDPTVAPSSVSGMASPGR